MQECQNRQIHKNGKGEGCVCGGGRQKKEESPSQKEAQQARWCVWGREGWEQAGRAEQERKYGSRGMTAAMQVCVG